MNAKLSFPSTGYDTCFAVEDNSFWFRHRNHVIGDILAAVPATKMIWDIGGGNGVVSKYLQDKGHHVTLLEPGTIGCKNASSRGVKNVICSHLDQLDRELQFDHAICCDVIEHIKDSGSFVENIAERMTAKGLFLVTVPAYSILWSREDEVAGHFKRYSKNEFINEICAAGFELEYSTYLFQHLVLPVYLLRTLPHRFHLSKKWTAKEMDSHIQAHLSHKSQIITFLLEREFRKIHKKKSLSYGTSLLGLFRKS